MAQPNACLNQRWNQQCENQTELSPRLVEGVVMPYLSRFFCINSSVKTIVVFTSSIANSAH